MKVTLGPKCVGSYRLNIPTPQGRQVVNISGPVQLDQDYTASQLKSCTELWDGLRSGLLRQLD